MLSNNSNKKVVFSKRMTIGINTLYYISVVLLIVYGLIALQNSGIALVINTLLVFVGLGVTAVLLFFIAMVIAYLVGSMIDIANQLYQNRRNKLWLIKLM